MVQRKFSKYFFLYLGGHFPARKTSFYCPSGMQVSSLTLIAAARACPGRVRGPPEAVRVLFFHSVTKNTSKLARNFLEQVVLQNVRTTPDGNPKRAVVPQPRFELQKFCFTPARPGIGRNVHDTSTGRRPSSRGSTRTSDPLYRQAPSALAAHGCSNKTHSFTN